MADAVHEEGGRPGHAAEVGRVDVLGDPGRALVLVQRLAEPVDGRARAARRSPAGRGPSARAWWASSRSCISQNLPWSAAASAASAASWALGWTSFSGRCRQTYRASPKSASRSRTTGSAWPQNGHSKSPYSTTVTGASIGPRMWSRSGSTSTARSIDHLRAADQRPDAKPLGQQRRRPEHDPCDRRGGQRRGQHAELCLLQVPAVEHQGRDQDRDREPDAGDRAAADDRRPADRRPQPAPGQPGHQPRCADDPDRLADARSRSGCRG